MITEASDHSEGRQAASELNVTIPAGSPESRYFHTEDNVGRHLHLRVVGYQWSPIVLGLLRVTAWLSLADDDYLG